MLITQDLNTIKKSKTLFFNIIKYRTHAKLQQKMWKSIVVGACFFRQITWFLRNDRTLSKFTYWIFHYLISIIKLWKNQFVQANFILTTRPPSGKKSRRIWSWRITIFKTRISWTWVWFRWTWQIQRIQWIEIGIGFGILYFEGVHLTLPPHIFPSK